MSLTTAEQKSLDLREYDLKRSDGSHINYYLDRKSGGESQTILVIVQGSDCNSVARHPVLPEYAEVAPDTVVLLVEKYGLTRDLPPSPDDNRPDCPIGYQKYDTIEQRVADYLQVFSRLREESWWNRKLIILAGSAGAGVGERLAALIPETERLVIFGFGGRWLEEDMLYGIRASMVAAGLDETVQDREIEQFISMIRHMRDNPSLDQFASGHSYAAWASMLNFDQFLELQAVQVPVLAIQGSRDQNVSPVGARALVKNLQIHGHNNVTYREYEDLDHGFTDSAGVSQRSRIIADIRAWLQGGVSD